MEDKKRFPLREAYIFANAHGLGAEAAQVRDMEIEWDRSYTSTVRRGRLIRLFEERGLMPQFVAEHWPDGGKAGGDSLRRAALRVSREYDEFLAGNSGPEEEDAPTSAEQESFEFALEAHLRDFLACNLEQIEPGLSLFQAQGRTGMEYPVDGGRIDILAVDREKRYVVIELKLTQGRNKALGQLLYYMGWVDQKLGRGERCRGVVIASEISPELAVAVSRAPGVALYRYRMNFVLERADRSPA